MDVLGYWMLMLPIIRLLSVICVFFALASVLFAGANLLNAYANKVRHDCDHC